MVEKKGGKSLLLGGLVVFVLLGVFVLATSTTNFPVANGNYSTTLVFNCTTDLPEALNASLLYNASGGAATSLLINIVNDTASDTEFYNGSVVITGLADGSTYNFTCFVSNETDTEHSSAVSGITIDDTVPAVVNFTNTVNFGNYSGTIVLNVSVSDATIGVGSVYFNITNSTGNQINFTKASTPGAGYYNITLNTSLFTDGVYNVTVYSNDTLNNRNNTERIQITMDNTVPVVSLSSSSATSSSLTISISGGGTCTSSRSGSTVSGATLTETGLSCGTSYSYIVTCTDSAGNSGASVSTSFSTSACGDGSFSSSSSVQTWTMTHKLNEDQIQEGYKKELSAKQRFEFKLGSQSHHVGVKSLTSSSAVIEIASAPVEVTLAVGETTKKDVDSDGYYDIYVELLGIINNKANVFVQEINEKVPVPSQEESSLDSEITEEESTSEPNFSPEEQNGFSWVSLFAIIFLLVAVFIGFLVYKKRK